MRPVIWLSILGASSFALAAAAWLAGSALSSPAPSAIGAAPADLGAIDVTFSNASGWLVPSGPPADCVVLMHGIRANRRAMIERARFLKAAGYTTLLFDFQAHGESPGQSITFGYLEARDASAAVAFLRTGGCRRVAALGQSLGGAAALLADPPLAVDALILESVYPTIEQAVHDRLAIRIGAIMASVASQVLLAQVPLRLGIDPTALRPIDGIRRVRSRLLVASGSEDRHTTIAEAQELFTAAPEPKELWAVQGAAHVDLYRFAGDVYRQRILGFLAAAFSERSS